MTLDQIANQVCIKTHDTSAGAVAVVKTFCKNRYQMIWDSQLWANSMAVTTQAITSGSSIITISDTNMDRHNRNRPSQLRLGIYDVTKLFH
jgi:hypothetical protein